MTVAETARLLGVLQLADNRTVDENTIRLWANLLSDLPLDEATDGLRAHLKNSTSWTQPGHIRDQVMLARSRRRPLSEQAWEARERLRALAADRLAAAADQPALEGTEDPVDVVTAVSGPVRCDEFGPVDQPDVRGLRSEDSRRLNAEYVHAVLHRTSAAQRARMGRRTPTVAPNRGVREITPQPAQEVVS